MLRLQITEEWIELEILTPNGDEFSQVGPDSVDEFCQLPPGGAALA